MTEQTFRDTLIESTVDKIQEQLEKTLLFKEDYDHGPSDAFNHKLCQCLIVRLEGTLEINFYQMKAMLDELNKDDYDDRGNPSVM